MMDLHNESTRRWITAALVGAALLSAAYWAEATLLRLRQGMPNAALQVGKASEAGPGLSAAAPAAAAPTAETMARLLGAQARLAAAPLGPAERFKVTGVMASATGRGVALVAVDGQPPRAYRVGAELAPGFVLKSVSQQELTLAASPDGEVLATLPLPEPGSAPVAGPSTGNAASGVNPSANSGPPAVSSSRGNPRSVEQAAPAATTPTPSGPATPSR